METTMDREGAYRPVGFAAAFLEQARLLWSSRRPLLLMSGLLGILALAGEPWNDNPMTRLFTVWPVWLLLIGPFWAFAVWHNEGPSNRMYFWSQPVSRTGHALARFAAGAAWLVALYVLLLLGGIVFAAFDGDLAHFGQVDAAAWVSFFTGPLLTYSVVSVLAVPSDYPIRWFLGILFGVPIVLSLLDEWLRLDGLVRTLLKPLGEPWGLASAAMAPFAIAMEQLFDDVAGTLVRRGGAADRFDVETWWVAMPLWLLFFVALVVLLARRHPDRFPRLRRGG